MHNYANEYHEASDNATTQRYGSDISFEITDRSQITKEIGNIGMVIDKIGKDGQVLGGLSVKTVPGVDTVNGKDILKPGETIMYVSSDSLLHVNGVVMGSKVLRVEHDADGVEHLFWGENQIV